MSGWIKLHRTLLDWEWIDSHRELRVFIELLLRANHTKSVWRGVEIMPGQILTGRKQLSQWTGLSERQIRTALDNLEMTNELTIKPTNRFSLITLVKWSEYQSEPTSQPPTERPEVDRQTTTSNNVKNNKKKRTLTEKEKKFLDWFNAQTQYVTGRPGKFKAMTQTDRNNLKKLREAYEDQADWTHAFRAMHENEWVVDNKKATIDHFLRIDNFSKYVNTDTKTQR